MSPILSGTINLLIYFVIAVILAFIVYIITTKDGVCDTERKERLERLSNIFVGAMMCLGGTLMLVLAFTADNE